MKILVADDDPVHVHLFRTTFEKRGWQVVSAVDAMQALMLTQKETGINVILLDINMPGGSGLKTLERLKASSKTSSIPVVVVSAVDDPDAPARVRALGAAAFVHKPVDAEALARAIEKAAQPKGS